LLVLCVKLLVLGGSYYRDQADAHEWYNRTHLQAEGRLWLEMNSGEKMLWIDEYRKTKA
jgi:hypothetical protein